MHLEGATTLFRIVAPAGRRKAQRFDSEKASFVMDPGEQLVNLVISPLDRKAQRDRVEGAEFLGPLGSQVDQLEGRGSNSRP